jgi:hypothetical protein
VEVAVVVVYGVLPVAASDTLSVGLTESSTLVQTAAGTAEKTVSDSCAVDMSDSSSVVIYGTIPKTASDTLAVALADSSAVVNVGGWAAANAFDGDFTTAWKPANFTQEQWIQGALASAVSVDSVRVVISEGGLSTTQDQTRVRGMRVRPSEYRDDTRPTSLICEALALELRLHQINRAYVYVYEMPEGETGSFFFDTGTADYEPFGLDDADFLDAFITAAAAESVEVYAVLPYMQNYVYGLANDKGLETDGGVYSSLWLCPNKSGVQAWYDAIITTLLTYSVDGVDFAEPQWGYTYGNDVCWCDECQAAFATAYPSSRFGAESPQDVYGTTAPDITDWEQWRADVLADALTDDIADVQTAGITASMVTFFGANPNGKVLDWNWKLVKEGLDVDSILDDTDAPDEIIYQATWQEKAAEFKDYTTFSPEWTEYATRAALSNHNGRSSTPIIHIGGYPTVAASGSDFSYGYDHSLTAAEFQAAFEAASRGGALHFDSYALHTLNAYDLWQALNVFWEARLYNAITCEVRWNDGGTWRPIGEQAWFNSRASADHLAHFTRKTEDQIRLYLTPAPESDREVNVKEIEFRYHSIQTSGDDLSCRWGGVDYDNHDSGWGDLVAVRYSVSSAVACTMNATADTVTSTDHDLRIDDQVFFATSVGGVTAGTRYYVIALTDPNTFQFSTTERGSAFNITADGTNSYSTSQAYLHRIDEDTGLDVGASPYFFDNYLVQAVNDLCVLPSGSDPRLLVLSQGDRGSRALLHRYSTAAPGTLVSSVSPNLGGRTTAFGGLAYQPSTVDGTDYLVIAVNTPNVGQVFYWVDPATLLPADDQISEVNWMWSRSLCWAGTPNNEFLFGESTYGVYILRPYSLLNEGEADDDVGDALTWDDNIVNLEYHPEKALSLSTSSQNRLIRVCCYVWVDAASGYLEPTVTATAVSADNEETSLGTLEEEKSWGYVKLLSLYLGRSLPECQYLKMTVTPAEGTTYIGILEVSANMAVTVNDIIEATARKLKDAGYGDWEKSELRDEAKDSIVEVIVAGNTMKDDVSITLVSGTQDYSIEPCHELSLVSLGGVPLETVYDADDSQAGWIGMLPGTPDQYRRETGQTIRIKPTPDDDAVGLIGTINEEPSDQGTGYIVGEILTLATGNADGKVEVTAIGSSGAVTAVKLIPNHRASRGSGYSVGATIATTSDGDGSGCTVEITALAKIEVTGYCGIPRPTADSDVITEIPEHYILPTCVPRTMAKALENRREGTNNDTYVGKKYEESDKWIARMTGAMKLARPAKK